MTASSHMGPSDHGGDMSYRDGQTMARESADRAIAAAIERDALLAEVARLRKLFDDAGQGEHNVLALIDHYQRAAMDADDRLMAVRRLLTEHGCECPCDHHPDERGPECDVCLACRIGEAVGT